MGGELGEQFLILGSLCIEGCAGLGGLGALAGDITLFLGDLFKAGSDFGLSCGDGGLAAVGLLAGLLGLCFELFAAGGNFEFAVGERLVAFLEAILEIGEFGLETAAQLDLLNGLDMFSLEAGLGGIEVLLLFLQSLAGLGADDTLLLDFLLKLDGAILSIGEFLKLTSTHATPSRWPRPT